MAYIRVTPEKLISAAQQLAEIGGQIGLAVRELIGALNDVSPSAYSGQLYSKVAARVSSGQTAMQGPANKVAAYAIALTNRGNAFLATDQAAIGEFSNLGRQGAVLGASMSASVSAILFPEGWSAKPQGFPNPQVQDIARWASGKGSDGWYFYYGYNEVNSDCTWYAAEAVKEASRGAIDLNAYPSPDELVRIQKNDSATIKKVHSEGRLIKGLGAASAWANSASEYARAYPDGPIAGVDRLPRVGDVIVFSDIGHVAFIEKLEVVVDDKGETKWKIRLSEESATGTGFAGSTTVTPQDGSNRLRWQREITVATISNDDLKVKETGIQFIHFRYPFLKLDLGSNTEANPSAHLRG